MIPKGLIFDFDGVLLDSEFASNRHLAELLSELGHSTSVEHALSHFTGLSGPAFLGAVERHVGRTLPNEFHERRAAEDQRSVAEGLAAVAGAVDFVRELSPFLPRAIASSSTSHWIRSHLDHMGLGSAFGEYVYSGHEHVARGKPAPDIYLHAASKIGVRIQDCAIIEDSEVGATGAIASGARVIGLVAGQHCSDGHEGKLRALGVREIARTFDEVRGLLGLP